MPLSAIPGTVASLALILSLGIGAQWLAWRIKLPSILLLLLFGFLAGPVTHLVQPDKLLGESLLPLVSLCVGLILFEGGMSLRVADLRQSGVVVWRLVSIGALVTAVVVSLSAHYIVQLHWPIAALLGAMLVVTGPTVIGPLLRHVRPIGVVGPILRWEGIIIDPIGALCAVLVFEALELSSSNTGLMTVVGLNALKTLGCGLLIGTAAAAAVTLVLLRYWIPDYLHNPLTLTVVIAALVGSNQIQAESGLFTVTVMGIALANQKWAQVHHIAEFKETLSLLLVSCLFILLASRLQMSQIIAIASWRTLAFLLIVILIARPLAVAMATQGSTLKRNERFFIAAIAPRGIVAAAISSVFALRLRAAHVAGADQLVPLVFVVIIGTVIAYGLSAARVGIWLGVAKPNAQGCLIIGAHTVARAIAQALHQSDIPVLIVDTNRAAINEARMLGLPTFFGSIIGPQAEEKLDLSSMGRLLALTPNDEVNALACVRFAKILGRAEVYQLAPDRGHTDTSLNRSRTEMSHQLRGRQLFAADCTLTDLQNRLTNGSVIKKTLLTEVFDLKAFQARHPDALPLFLQATSGELYVLSEDAPPVSRVGQTVISLTDATPTGET